MRMSIYIHGGYTLWIACASLFPLFECKCYVSVNNTICIYGSWTFLKNLPSSRKCDQHLAPHDIWILNRNVPFVFSQLFIEFLRLSCYCNCTGLFIHRQSIVTIKNARRESPTTLIASYALMKNAGRFPNWFALFIAAGVSKHFKIKRRRKQNKDISNSFP